DALCDVVPCRRLHSQHALAGLDGHHVHVAEQVLSDAGVGVPAFDHLSGPAFRSEQGERPGGRTLLHPFALARAAKSRMAASAMLQTSCGVAMPPAGLSPPTQSRISCKASTAFAAA